MSLEGDIEFECEGKKWNVARLTQEVQDAYGRWAEQHCFQVLRHSRAMMDDREYNHLLSEHQQMKRLGQFELLPGSEAMKLLLNTEEGYKKLVYLCFRKRHGVMPEEVAGMMDRNEEQFKELFLDIMSSKKKWLTGRNAGGSCSPQA